MIRPTRDSRKPVTLLCSGSGRGSQRNQLNYAEVNGASRTFRLDPFHIDPALGKAQDRAEEGKELGLNTTALEARGEDVLQSLSEDEPTPVVVTIDNAGGIRDHLQSNAQTPLFVNSIVDFPGLGATGWQLLVGPEDHQEKTRFADFFDVLAKVSARGGTRDVFGPRGSGVNRISEQGIRARFGEHFRQNIGKVVHGLEPESPHGEVTILGRKPSQVVMLEKQPEWRNAKRLLGNVQDSIRSPIRPGTDLMAVELGEESLRLHQIRYRKSDSRFSLLNRTWLPEPPPKGLEEVPAPLGSLSKLNAALVAD